MVKELRSSAIARTLTCDYIIATDKAVINLDIPSGRFNDPGAEITSYQHAVYGVYVLITVPEINKRIGRTCSLKMVAVAVCHLQVKAVSILKQSFIDTRLR